jgi:hypothetical protein
MHVRGLVNSKDQEEAQFRGYSPSDVPFQELLGTRRLHAPAIIRL